MPYLVEEIVEEEEVDNELSRMGTVDSDRNVTTSVIFFQIKTNQKIDGQPQNISGFANNLELSKLDGTQIETIIEEKEEEQDIESKSKTITESQQQTSTVQSQLPGSQMTSNKNTIQTQLSDKPEIEKLDLKEVIGANLEISEIPEQKEGEGEGTARSRANETETHTGSQTEEEGNTEREADLEIVDEKEEDLENIKHDAYS